MCDGGVLAFKWSDYDIPFKKVFELAPYRPLFGDRRGRTRWTFFVKCEALKKEMVLKTELDAMVTREAEGLRKEGKIS